MSDETQKINWEDKVSREENIALFDDYLNGHLPSDEKNAFEERLSSDGAFKEEFEAYQQETQAIHDAAEYSDIVAELEDIHGELYGRARKPIYLRPKFVIPLAAAACFALFLLVADPFGGAQSGDTASADDEYAELSADTTTVMFENADYADEGGETEDNMSQTFEAPMYSDSISSYDLFGPDSLLNPARGRPMGTGFMISSNGYFLTAKHLLKKRSKVRLQHKDLGYTFYARKVYVDSFLDFAILKCDERVVHLFESVRYKFYRKDQVMLGQEVFTLGYPKRDIVYTEGAVGSETGFLSDSNYFEISMPANKGNSGAPLFTEKGELVGIIAANNTKKQSVTYVLKHTYIKDKIDELIEKDSMDIDMRSNKLQRYSSRSALIDAIRPFIFEVHSYK